MSYYPLRYSSGASHPDVGAHVALVLPQPVQELPALKAVAVLNARVIQQALYLANLCMPVA